MEKNGVLRRIVSLLLILTLITSAFVNLPLSVSAADEGLQGGQSNIVNGSFEYPALRATDTQNDTVVGNGWASIAYNNQAYDPDQLGWKTTATDNLIEYAWLKNTDVASNMSPHIKPVTVQKVEGVAASDGVQFAEVVANKVSSLFQVLPVKAGEDYSWKVHHRGRSGTDTLAFIIADKSVDYKVPSSGSSDCFQQILTWLKSSKNVTAPAAGEMAEYTVYTTELNSDLYSFKTASSGSYFSDSEDDQHTEKFSVYLMSTAKSDWGEYKGTYTADANKDIFFVLSPFSTTFSSASGGNLVDNMSFTDKIGNNLLENAGFDDVAINVTYSSLSAANAVPPTTGVGWSTTATDFKVEVGNIQKGDAYGLGAKITTETIKPDIRDGIQFAELNASQESSLYQMVTTDPGKMYKWSLSHRARDNIDTMALIIGPAQFDSGGGSLPPKKTSSTARDQLMQISDWLYSQTYMPLDLPTDGGCSDKIKVYTPKFNSNGGWAQSSNIFSFYKDSVHTEEWSVWVIASKNDKWYDYGELDSSATYSYECVIPEGQINTIFGFVSHSSLKADGTKNSLSYGNLLDNIAFKEYYYAKVEVAMNSSHGWATVSANNEDAFLPDSKNNQTGWALMGGTVTINIKEWDEDDPKYRKFVGAYVNGKFIPKTDSAWVYDEEDGSYNYTITNVNSAIKVNVIFSAQQIYYDTRSPNEYQYDPDNSESGPEVPMSSGGLTEYTSHEPDLTNLDGWKFKGWKYINPADSSETIFKAEHIVTLVGEPGTAQTFTVSDTVFGGEHTIKKIPYNEGVTFLAQWKYRQRAIAQTYDEDASQYIAGTKGGTVDISVSFGQSGEEDEAAVAYNDDEGNPVGRELYSYADDTYVTVTATRESGYTFNGWYDSSGNLVNKNASYVYKVNSGVPQTLYAHFDPAGCDLKLDCSTYSSESGDTGKYIKIYCFLSGLRVGKLYTLSYVSGSSVSNESFEADANGKATVILNMKHGDSAMFVYLPVDSTYTIEADDTSSAGFGVKGEVTYKLLTRPAGSQETIPVITEHIIFFKASQSALIKDGKHYEGIAAGEDEITITKNSSYTLDVETRYNPSIYDESLIASLCFYNATSDDAKNFADKTRILMIDLSIGETPKYYSYTVNTEINTIPLTDFTELGSTGTNFTVKTGDMLTEKLVFIVDYVDTDNLAESGKVSLVYDDANHEIINDIKPTKLAVNIDADTTDISADVGDGRASRGGPFAINITVKESKPAINTTYKEDDFTQDSKYAVKLSAVDSSLPDGSYAEVGGKKYFLNNGYIKIPLITAGACKVNVYSPVPISSDTVTFNVTLSDAVSASPNPEVPAEKTVTVEFNCVDVAMDADVVDKVLNPGSVSSVDVIFKHIELDSVRLTVYEKGGNTPLTATDVNNPTDGNIKFSFDSSLNAISGKTYIFSFIGYVNGTPVLEDKCCVVGGYISK